MTVFSPRHDFKKDLARVRRLSSLIEGRLESSDSKIQHLSTEQLQDLGEVLRLADYILTKHEDKKDIHDLLKEFVDMIRRAAESIDGIDTDIDELVLSTETSIALIRDAQASVAERVDFDRNPART